MTKETFKTKEFLLGLSAGLICIVVFATFNAIAGNSGGVVEFGKLAPFEEIEQISDREVEKEITNIRKELSNLTDNSSYFQASTGSDTYMVSVFNKDGQGFVQDTATGNISVFRGDNTSVLFSDQVGLVHDINVLQMLDFGLDLVSEGVANMYRDTAIKNDIMQVRYVDIMGFDNIHKLYSKIDTDFADMMVTNLRANTLNKGDVALRLIYVTAEEGVFSGGCNIIIGDEELASWSFDGYINIGDWELSNKWFEHDYEDEETVGEVEEMLMSLVGDIDKLLHQYADENDVPELAEHEDVGDNPIVREDELGHYHEDGTFHPHSTGEEYSNDSNPIVREDELGHYHEDGTFCYH